MLTLKLCPGDSITLTDESNGGKVVAVLRLSLDRMSPTKIAFEIPPHITAMRATAVAKDQKENRR